jgi:peptidoglycan/LPS O-acetylase OafA/YrhL
VIPLRPGKHRATRLLGYQGTLSQLYAGRDNGIGLLRLVLALAVVLGHATVLGFGREDLGRSPFRGQTDVGVLAVFAFFVLSGLLITRSAVRMSIGRFAWHRALRILPGLWVCLLVTAFVVAPLMTWAERGNLDGFWAGPHGPLQYIWGNWFVGVRQYGIHDLFRNTTPWGRQTGSSVIDGPLWSLIYEIGCYTAAGLLAVTAVLRRARWVVLVAAGALFGLIIADQFTSRTLDGPPAIHHGSVNLPLFGVVYAQWAAYLGFLFLAGASLQLYREHVPIHDGLGLICLAAVVVPLFTGGFLVIGLPALVYLLVWIAVRAPRRLRGIGRRTDLSYGIYIYGFVGQQVLASLGVNRWGFLPYTALSVAIALAAAYASWNVVERRALALKDWTPKRRGSLPATPGEGPARSRPGRTPECPADADEGPDQAQVTTVTTSSVPTLRR